MNLPHFLAIHPDAILVEVAEAKGSTPREAGAFMVVATDALHGTIGGGQLEFLAIDHARQMLLNGEQSAVLDVPLGPEIGQCCGGRAGLALTRLDATARAALIARQGAVEKAYPDVFVFGAGHVGLALTTALGPLPLTVTLIETRDVTDDGLPQGTTLRRVAMPEAEVAAIGKWFEKVMSRLCSPFLSEAEIGTILKGSDVWMDSDEIRRRLMRMQRARTVPRKTSPAKGKKVPRRIDPAVFRCSHFYPGLQPILSDEVKSPDELARA